MNTSENREQRPIHGSGIALSVLIVVAAAALVLVLTGCTAKESASTAFTAFAQPCARNSFTCTVDAAGPLRTFTATCKVRQ